MKTFRFNDKIEIVCEWKKTQTAFKHEATLLIDGNEVETVKICYLNRTWERFEFESVINKLLEKTEVISEGDAIKFLNSIANKQESPFKGIAMVAKLGDIFGQTPKEKNDWKARMLKAGLENKGLIMPDDWDTLSEEEKGRRLDEAIKEIA